MRIIAGRFKGRKLMPPEGDAIRPTSDRARESIFNLLMHGQFGGTCVLDQHIADLCCGTGALGLEALSRGAHSATFVDTDKKALALAQQNAIHCGISSACHFVQGDVTRLPSAREPVSLVLMDAPYDSPLLAKAYTSLRAQGWLQAETLIICEQHRDAAVMELDGAPLLLSRNYGKTTVHIYRVD